MQRLTLIIAAVAAGACTPTALGQMGPNLDLSWNTIDGGGGVSTGGGFELIGTIGQVEAGAASGGGFTLGGGFLGSGGPPPCYPDCNGSGSLTVADFACFQSKFVAADPYADCNQSASLTIADFGCFQTTFVAGCP